VALPLTGNPFSAVGVVGHSGPVNSLATQFDGKRFFTSGASLSQNSEPGCVCIWSVSETALKDQVALGGTGVNSFLNLLDTNGVESGSKYAEICDVFSYAQVHAQGEDSSLPRMAGTSIPSSELASVMRALGYFPTAEELTALVNESNHSSSSSTSSHGESSGSVDLSTLVKLYINHRPVLPPTGNDLKRALEIIIQHPSVQTISTTDEDAPIASEPSISWRSLKQALASGGDNLSSNEAQTCLTALIGEEGKDSKVDEDEILTVNDFVSKILQVEQ
jgi:Ca2+-binding EF-hand superfamily protein